VIPDRIDAGIFPIAAGRTDGDVWIIACDLLYSEVQIRQRQCHLVIISVVESAAQRQNV
jgi:hypothetical protein